FWAIGVIPIVVALPIVFYLAISARGLQEGLLIGLAVGTLALVCWVGLVNLIFHLWQVLRATFIRRGRHYRWRKKLSALLSVRHRLMPQGLSELLEDDRLFAEHVQRFLAEHQVPYALPLYGPAGEYLYKEPRKVEVLARALLRAVARGKDN